MHFEVQLANATMTPEQDSHDHNHDVTIASLQRRYPQLQWRQYVEGVFREFGISITLLPDHPLVSVADIFLDNMFPLLRSTSSDIIKDYFLWKAALTLIPYTRGPMNEAKAKFDGHPVHDEAELRAVFCAWDTTFVLPHVVGDMYTRAHTTARDRHSVASLTKRVMRAEGQMIQRADWLSPETIRRVKAKLAAMGLEVGIPTVYNDTDRLDREWGQVPVHNDTFLLNYLALYRRGSELDLRTYRLTRRQVLWDHSSAEPNAYYLGRQNAIIVPSGKSPLIVSTTS